MISNSELQKHDDIRVLSGDEISHVAGGLGFLAVLGAAVAWAVGHPSETKTIATTAWNGAKKLWNWIF